MSLRSPAASAPRPNGWSSCGRTAARPRDSPTGSPTRGSRRRPTGCTPSARSPGSPAAASWAPSRRSPRCSGRTSTSPCTRPRWTCSAPTAELADAVDRRPAVRAGRPDLRRHQRDPAQHHRRAAAGSAPGEGTQMKFELDEQQRDFAASIDAALGAADRARPRCAPGPPATPRPAARCGRSWPTSASLRWLVPEKFDGIEAHPVDLVVAARTARPLVRARPGHRIHRRGTGFARRRRALRRALASGELIATVALPPHVPRAVDADTAGLVLLADRWRVTRGTRGEQHESVDPSRRLFDVTATGDDLAGRRRSAPSSSACWPPPRSWSAPARRCWTRRSTTPSSAASSAG